MEKGDVKLFEKRKVRSVWDDTAEKWWFSVVDIVAILTEQTTPRGASNYWAKLKERLAEEGNQLLTNCQQLKMIATDGKERLTDVADTEQILRLIQSIPSKKAEPFKTWLAEATATELSARSKPKNLAQSAKSAKGGATVAKNARMDIEKRGGKVISSQNAKQLGKRVEMPLPKKFLYPIQ